MSSKLLIDTHVFIWLTKQTGPIGPRTMAMLMDTHNELLLSYFSLLEMRLKAVIGKLEFDPNLLEALPEANIQLLMPEVADVQIYRVFNAANKDPFDNLLLTVAQNTKATFITSDQKILSTKTSVKLLDARH